METYTHSSISRHKRPNLATPSNRLLESRGLNSLQNLPQVHLRASQPQRRPDLRVCKIQNQEPPPRSRILLLQQSFSMALIPGQIRGHEKPVRRRRADDQVHRPDQPQHLRHRRLRRPIQNRRHGQPLEVRRLRKHRDLQKHQVRRVRQHRQHPRCPTSL